MKKSAARILDGIFRNQFREKAISQTVFLTDAPSETTCYETDPQVLLADFFIGVGPNQTLSDSLVAPGPMTEKRTK